MSINNSIISNTQKRKDVIVRRTQPVRALSVSGTSNSWNSTRALTTNLVSTTKINETHSLGSINNNKRKWKGKQEQETSVVERYNLNILQNGKKVEPAAIIIKKPAAKKLTRQQSVEFTSPYNSQNEERKEINYEKDSNSQILRLYYPKDTQSQNSQTVPNLEALVCSPENSQDFYAMSQSLSQGVDEFTIQNTREKEREKQQALSFANFNQQTTKEEKAGSSLNADFWILRIIREDGFSKLLHVRGKVNGKESILLAQYHFNFPNKKKNADIKHSFIQQVQTSNRDSSFIFSSFELNDGYITLESQLSSISRLDLEVVQFLTAQLVIVLEHLHLKNVSYRILHPDNILINQNGYIKLIPPLQTIITTGHLIPFDIKHYVEYLAPEMIASNGKSVSPESDWWSLGVLVYQLLAGKVPFEKLSDGKINSQQEIKQWPDIINAPSKELIKNLLCKNVEKRREYGYNIRNHKFFKKLEWKKIENQEIFSTFKPTENNSMMGTMDLEVNHELRFNVFSLSESGFGSSNPKPSSTSKAQQNSQQPKSQKKTRSYNG
jgi:hypothetical protein